MSGEMENFESRRDRPRWVKRLTGAACVTTALFMPACTNAEATEMSHHTDDTSLQIPDQDSKPPDVTKSSTLTPISELPPAWQRLTRDTGIDMASCVEFRVCGTDLGIPFLLPNGSVGYLFGDTFQVAGPHLKDLPRGGDMWRSPTMMRSNEHPTQGKPIYFDSAVGVGPNERGIAAEIIPNAHRRGPEISVLPNDAVSLPNGDIILSYMSIAGGMTGDNPGWTTNYAGLAISHDGNHFERIPATPGAPIWSKDTDPGQQMWSMQLDGDYVYIVATPEGRRQGSMTMLRVRWEQMLDKSAYECWNGGGWGGECKPILPDAKYGEPSLRKLRDGKWALSYVDYNYTHLVTHTADSPEGPWSAPTIQMNWRDLNAMYGGFIHPYSTSDNLIMMVSTWQTEGESTDVKERKLLRYDISHLIGRA